MQLREYKYEGNELYLKCTKCGERGGVDNFPKCKSKKFGIRPFCRKCARGIKSKFYFAHKEELNEKNREYQRVNKERINKRLREYYRIHNDIANQRASKWRKNHLDIINERKKKHVKNRSSELGFNRESFHNKATLYVKKYSLRPSVCSICNTECKVEMHHPSYNSREDWKNIVFCCHKCHAKIHLGEIKCPPTTNLLNLSK